jgi:hypothetical protein
MNNSSTKDECQCVISGLKHSRVSVVNKGVDDVA